MSVPVPDPRARGSRPPASQSTPREGSEPGGIERIAAVFSDLILSVYYREHDQPEDPRPAGARRVEPARLSQTPRLCADQRAVLHGEPRMSHAPSHGQGAEARAIRPLRRRRHRLRVCCVPQGAAMRSPVLERQIDALLAAGGVVGRTPNSFLLDRNPGSSRTAPAQPLLLLSMPRHPYGVAHPGPMGRERRRRSALRVGLAP